jgi:hypothetical protein
MAEEKKRFSVATRAGVDEVIEHVINSVAGGTMAKSQSDPINTAVKQVSAHRRIEEAYVRSLLDVFKEHLRNRTFSLTDVLNMLPEFYRNKATPPSPQPATNALGSVKPAPKPRKNQKDRAGNK